MLIDFKNSKSATTIEADICIIGAGAAGITLAHSLLSSGLNVCLLESGGLTYDKETELLNDISINKNIKYNIEGDKFDRDRACRLRYFGGTTNHWAGWCAPLDELDFEVRDWVPHSGWPINRQDLEPYYQKAYQYCQIDSDGYAIETLSDADHQFPDYEAAKIDTTFWKISPPTRFGQVYREALEQSENVTVYLNANLVKIETSDAAATVSKFHVQSLNGNKGTVTAKNYVLACGALENARILLLNQGDKNGLGNESDWVGRNYQNHPHIQSALIRSSDPQMITKLYSNYNYGETNVLAGVAASPQSQKDNGILNCSARMRPFSGYSTARQLWNSLKNFKWPNDFSTKVKLVISDFLKGDSNADQVHELYMFTEQAPNLESRIRLGDEKDSLGQRKVIVDWNLADLDKHTVQAGTRLIAEEFGRLNLGRVQISDWVSEDASVWPTSLWGGCHQIGSTRMSQDPKDGVVDSNCRIHSMDNLYIAGSSVFPTGGHVPPTLTIVALATRLADHLKKQTTT